jgi:hypothetical protein
MKKELRKSTSATYTSHPRLASVRLLIVNATLEALKPLDDSFKEKAETLTRRFVGGKMPKHIACVMFGYSVKACIGGIMFDVAHFKSLGGRENHKLAVPLSRLADAITYHFRNSRRRGVAEYNFTIEQAKADDEILKPALETLATLLVECGFPVMGNPISEIKFPPAPREFESFDTKGAIEVILKRLDMACDRFEAIEKRLAALEHTGASVGYYAPESVLPQSKTVEPIGTWCEINFKKNNNA